MTTKCLVSGGVRVVQDTEPSSTGKATQTKVETGEIEASMNIRQMCCRIKVDRRQLKGQELPLLRKNSSIETTGSHCQLLLLDTHVNILQRCNRQTTTD